MALPVVIVGLGNPGPEYTGHRHNIGFATVETLAKRLGLEFGLPTADCRVAVGCHAGREVFLVEPLRYMNRSGQALAAWARSERLPLDVIPDPEPDVDAMDEDPGEDVEPSPVIVPMVVCDDLSLPLGSVRFRARGSSGGQNGLASVIDTFGGEGFPRMRLGIAPLDRVLDPAEWADYVLEGFLDGEMETVEEVIRYGAEALEFWLDNGLESAVSRFNRRVRRPAPEDA